MIIAYKKLWRTLPEYGVKGRLFISIKVLYEGGRARVKVKQVEVEVRLVQVWKLEMVKKRQKECKGN